MKHTFIIAIALLLVACVDPGARHQANVYSTGQVNQRQEVKTISILSIVPAKVEVDNSHNQKIAKSVVGLLGAVAGVALGNNSGNELAGGLIGGVAGNAVGGLVAKNKILVDGVQIIYQEGSRTLSSAQVGRPCDYAIGTALAIVTDANETRIQSNHNCIKGQEMVIGSVSKLGNTLGAGIQAQDQNSLDDLERQRELLTKQRRVQEQITGLSKEKQRTRNANESADIELENQRERAYRY